jgi:hypothetical protein
MPQFWWVNHKQTFRQEIDGQYLWSPKTGKNGVRNKFYNNMRRANPGDLVLSYANQTIGYVGRVVEFAFTAPKPTEFGSTGSYWNKEGWLLPVYWTPLNPPVKPKTIIGTLGPLLPSLYSPINPISASGYQHVYLAEISADAFQTVTAHTGVNLVALAHGGSNSLTFDIVNEQLEDAVQQMIFDDPKLESTEKDAIIRARRGQGKFRNNVEAIEAACRLTGITNPALLIASHIKPWRLCSSGTERLDGMNGLLLTPDADHLFDRGFISFHDDGEVLVSPRVDQFDLRRLGFDQLIWQRFGVAEAPISWRTESFAPPQRNYLDFHRKQVFIS